MIAIAIAVFLATAIGFHTYWGLGGQYARHVSVPHKIDGTPLFVPSALATLSVALILLFMLAALAIYSLRLDVSLPRAWLRALIAALAFVFLARGLSWHPYVGLFKTVRITEFGRKDTWFYSPACVLAGVGLLVLAWEG